MTSASRSRVLALLAKAETENDAPNARDDVVLRFVIAALREVVAYADTDDDFGDISEVRTKIDDENRYERTRQTDRPRARKA